MSRRDVRIPVIMMMMMIMLQRVSDLEAEMSNKAHVISSLNSELKDLKDAAVNVDDLRRSARDLQRQLDLARDSDDVTQQKNAELRQTLKSKENQLEVVY